MRTLRLTEIADAVRGAAYGEDVEVSTAVVDGRAASPGALFVALSVLFFFAAALAFFLALFSVVFVLLPCALLVYAALALFGRQRVPLCCAAHMRSLSLRCSS